jgi:hypothetical protein
MIWSEACHSQLSSCKLPDLDAPTFNEIVTN